MNQCPACHNTGSLSKELTGYLDCTSCDTADQRVQLAARLRYVAPEPGDVRDWAAYQLGRLAESERQLNDQAPG